MTQKPPISPEDYALFQKEMQSVTPLKAKKPKVSPDRTPPTVMPKKRPHPIDLPFPHNSRGLCDDLSDYYAHPVQSETLLHYHQPGVSRLQVHALKTGTLSYQAKLDLHGLKPDAAKERLGQFLSQQMQQQHRWVLIIHGKGGRFGEAPVLKNLVNRWLPQIPQVLGFHSAQAKHGGAGAMYVLLK